MNKNIIFIGSNSNFVQDILKNKYLLKKYSKIYLLSHRKYNYNRINKIIIENVNPFEIISVLKQIIQKSEKTVLWDILISNTPPQSLNFDDHIIREWSITSIKIMNFLSHLSNINRAIFLGSSLSFVPFLKNSKYKTIKKIEFEMFYYMGFYEEKKIGFCILPPISPGVQGIGRFFSQEQTFWTNKIIKEFDRSNKIIMPSGIIGIILKLLLIIKLVKI